MKLFAFLWLFVLLIIASCATPRATPVRPAQSRTIVHQPTARVPYRWTKEVQQPAIHGDATDDLVSDDGRRILAPRP